MAFMSLESSNEQMSYIIQKNPTSKEGMVMKSIRKGYGFGWFPPNNAQKYCMRFMDSPQEMSYSKKDYEYLDVSALSSPSAYSNLIRDFLGSVLKNQSPLDTEGQHTLVFGFIKCHKRSLDFFTKYFQGVSYEEVSKGTYQVILQGSNIYYLIHLGNLFCLFMMLKEEELYIDINGGLIDKYLNSMSVIKCPYYIANLFKVQLLNSKTLFNKFSKSLSDACIEDVSFQFGNTLQARQSWVESNIQLRKNLVDVGAGKEFNMGRLSNNIQGWYYPIDRDESARGAIDAKAISKKWDSVHKCLSDWNEVEELLDRNTEVILSEVLEHNELQEAIELLDEVLDNPYVKRVLITLPLKEFNKYYLISDDEFRHDDHKWELTSGIQEEINQYLSNKGVTYTWSSIGDVLMKDQYQELSPSRGLLIVKEEE